ncbi:MAG TPA: glycoside hydrolase family 57 protein [Gemmatimonadales bacterium]|nr:glycoside hydrolase family 57 protein [Gemmatimonadales bacterium]
MNVWHLTPDAPRLPHRVRGGEPVVIRAGTWPIEPHQHVWIDYAAESIGGRRLSARVDASWDGNEGANSYWRATLGPFAAGDQVGYEVRGFSPSGVSSGGRTEFRVGAKLYLALLWHQHQPLYRNLSASNAKGSYLKPWVRLHAIRDYYAMAAILQDYPQVHVTINLTPALLWQLEDYLTGGATDRALELTLKPAESLTQSERQELLGSFFEADWHNQIFPHPGYARLFTRRLQRGRFGVQDLHDLQMWFNLAWFGHDFRTGEVALPGGEVVSVRRFVEQDRGYTHEDILAMVDQQFRIMRSIVPLHRALEEDGQIEVSTTPFFHPILPILVDSDRATIDRPGATHPPRFSYPEDADAQIDTAVEYHVHTFGRRPRGMWPAEGAVAQFTVPYFARRGIGWIATDRQVLARSGRWGYPAEDPDVYCQPYRAVEGGDAVAVFFRDWWLSDQIGFHRHAIADCEGLARTVLAELKGRYASRFSRETDRVLTVGLDGENAWGNYREDGRAFLHAFYRLLADDSEIQTVTLSEFLAGNPARGVSRHGQEELAQVHNLFTGSWIDERGSAPGVDLGTWIGEPEENEAWALLGIARAHLRNRGVTRSEAGRAYQAADAAEGSDWFWWFGKDQDSGSDDRFDDLFRLHLKTVFSALGDAPPARFDRHIVRHRVVWTFARPVDRMQMGDDLTVQTNCPGTLSWQFDDGPVQESPLFPVQGSLAAAGRFSLTLAPLPARRRAIRFRFRCTHPDCDGSHPCRLGGWETVAVSVGE